MGDEEEADTKERSINNRDETCSTSVMLLDLSCEDKGIGGRQRSEIVRR